LTRRYGPTFHNWNVGPYDFLVSLRYAALGLLAQHPGSGYDLLKRFELSMAHVWPATQSQLYGELNKLADSGLIEVTAVGPRGRKEYAATDAGRAELLRWILDSGDDPPVRSAELLRVFLLSEIPADKARKHMMAAAEQADAELKHLEQLRDSVSWTAGDTDFYASAALEYGQRQATMAGDWARWLVRAIDERPPK
jgi:DNA-binding PadR family transcriptional regulator